MSVAANPTFERPRAGLIDELLRDRAAFLARIEDPAEVAPMARALLLTICASAAVFGAALGSFRLLGPHASAAQVLFAGVKLPLVVLLTAGIVTPALYAMERALGSGRSFAGAALLVLGALALGSMVLAAYAPVVVLAILGGADYHRVILLVVGGCVVAGGFGLSLFARGLLAGRRPGRWLCAVASLALFAVVGAQMAWSLRPYLVRPRAVEVPFVRAVDEGFLDSVLRSSRSARGDYSRGFAPLPGEVDDAER